MHFLSVTHILLAFTAFAYAAPLNENAANVQSSGSWNTAPSTLSSTDTGAGATAPLAPEYSAARPDGGIEFNYAPSSTAQPPTETGLFERDYSAGSLDDGTESNYVTPSTSQPTAETETDSYGDDSLDDETESNDDTSTMQPTTETDSFGEDHLADSSNGGTESDDVTDHFGKRGGPIFFGYHGTRGNTRKYLTHNSFNSGVFNAALGTGLYVADTPDVFANSNPGGSICTVYLKSDVTWSTVKKGWISAQMLGSSRAAQRTRANSLLSPKFAPTANWMTSNNEVVRFSSLTRTFGTSLSMVYAAFLHKDSHLIEQLLLEIKHLFQLVS
ncbi:hypothetical protein GYMLUDRAFT_54383 [Collybiopsis luxurians FD-317 M1]|nr:hypothetical protein GYMLUDRAFT_54383 [Collybiopsis luxurians FD-317 M1]